MIRTSSSHLFYEAPRLTQFVSTVTVHRLVIVLGVFLAVAAFRRQLDWRDWDGWMLLICTSLALFPLLIRYGLSAGHLSTSSYPATNLWRLPGLRCAGAWP
jgi:uncharacterized membrane protein HdeD (DUF308 family)